ncbi:hypothetical protein STRDD11_00757 [Streptococcus sp. DD11]|nr:hypothetical protein STRDD11_00757 [Streptococcus sp. DD11]
MKIEADTFLQKLCPQRSLFDGDKMTQTALAEAAPVCGSFCSTA